MAVTSTRHSSPRSSATAPSTSPRASTAAIARRCATDRRRCHVPRRIIRYAQVGMKAELLASKELWTCYYCGECSETCPRQAERASSWPPRAAMRSPATTAPVWPDDVSAAVLGALIAVMLAAVFALFMYAGHGPQTAHRSSSSSSSHRS